LSGTVQIMTSPIKMRQFALTCYLEEEGTGACQGQGTLSPHQ
jgi:hypothetical protein